MSIIRRRDLHALILSLWCANASAAPVHHYVFFGQDREKLARASAFLDTRVLEGAQVAYSWRQLEPDQDTYDFSLIRDDLAFLTSRGKKLFVQLQDVTFSASRINVPRYLLSDKRYNGGADKQYRYKAGDEAHAVVEGWVARRWDPAVQQRFHKLLFALGKEFDGRIEGINLAETSVDFGESGRLFPKGFSFARYRNAIITNMRVLKQAFPRSVAMQYANFMPGEWRPTEDRGYLRAVYAAAKKLKVGVGGPDLLPHRPGQLKGSYPLIREAAGLVPTGIAVQDGNYEDEDPKTQKRVTVPELLKFATGYLKVDYIFWCTQEPYYSKELLPFLTGVRSLAVRSSPRRCGGVALLFITFGNDGSAERVDDVMRAATLHSRRSQLVVHVPTVRFQDHPDPVRAKVAVRVEGVRLRRPERFVGRDCDSRRLAHWLSPSVSHRRGGNPGPPTSPPRRAGGPVVWMPSSARMIHGTPRDQAEAVSSFPGPVSQPLHCRVRVRVERCDNHRAGHTACDRPSRIGRPTPHDLYRQLLPDSPLPSAGWRRAAIQRSRTGHGFHYSQNTSDILKYQAYVTH